MPSVPTSELRIHYPEYRLRDAPDLHEQTRRDILRLGHDPHIMDEQTRRAIEAHLRTEYHDHPFALAMDKRKRKALKRIRDARRAANGKTYAPDPGCGICGKKLPRWLDGTDQYQIGPDGSPTCSSRCYAESGRRRHMQRPTAWERLGSE